MALTSRHAATALLLGLCCLVVACDTASDPGEPSSATSSPTASPTPPSATPAAPDDPSMGVAAVRWPDQLDELGAHLEKLPPVLLDAQRDVYVDEEDSPVATALYGDLVYLTADLEHKIDTASGKRQRVTAEESLAGLFNRGHSCDKKTYRGTIRPIAGGQGPRAETRPSAKTRWFSCTIGKAEGDEDYTGHAIGWLRGKSAWLVIADAGEPAAQAMVGALVDAAD